MKYPHSRITLLVAAVYLITAAGIHARDPFTANIYPGNSAGEEPVYVYFNESIREGDTLTLRHMYTYPDGPLFAMEEVVLKNGEMVAHRTHFPVLREYSEILRTGDRIDMEFSRKGKSRSRNLRYDPDFVFGPTQQDFIRKHFAALMAGTSVRFTIPVPEFRVTATFSLQRVERSPYCRPGTEVLEMKTRNLLPAIFAEPNYFVVDADTGRILEVHGPTVLKTEVNDSWEFLTVNIYFDYAY